MVTVIPSLSRDLLLVKCLRSFDSAQDDILFAVNLIESFRLGA